MLVKTASVSSSSPAELISIDDADVAFAFNVECANVQNEWEMEREAEKEKRQLELLTGQAMTSVLGGPRERTIRETITPSSDIRDQGW